MKYNQIPNTNLNISVITLGTWVFSGDCWQGAKDEESIEAVHAALECGINIIDTAPIYGYGRAEILVGKAIKEKRDKVVIATKCGLVGRGKSMGHDLSPKSILVEIDESLRRLQTDYVDIYQCHWPDPATPIEKTMECLLKLKDQGKIRHIGVSNFDAPILKKALACAPIITLQNQYSILDRSIEKDVLPCCQEKEVSVLCYGPMAGGILSGKYRTPPQFPGGDARKFFYKYYEGDAFQKVQQLLKGLSELGKPLNQVAINWLRAQEGVASVIVGARNKTQAQQNAAAGDWYLTKEEINHINSLA